MIGKKRLDNWRGGHQTPLHHIHAVATGRRIDRTKRDVEYHCRRRQASVVQRRNAKNQFEKIGGEGVEGIIGGNKGGDGSCVLGFGEGIARRQRTHA